MDFRISRTDGGFSVSGPHGRAALVGLSPWKLMVGGGRKAPLTFDLAVEEEVLREVASRLLYGVPGKRRRNLALLGDDTVTRLRAERVRLLEKVPPEVMAVHEAIASAGGDATLARSEEFYERPLLVRDVVRYRAAAIAVGHQRSFIGGEAWLQEYPGDPAAEEFPGPDAPAEATLRTNLEVFEQWPGLFAPRRRPYRSLYRTLMNLPRSVRGSWLRGLRDVILPRPIRNPIELRAVCAVGFADNPQLSRIVLLATEEEIRRAVSRVAAHTRQTLRPHVVVDLARVMLFLSDYPGLHAGRLGGLVEKAIRWHRDVGRTNGQSALEAAGIEPDTPTATPPIPPPENPEIRFLRTAGEIVEEGREMGHCVAFRTSAAISGGAFLFHVEYGDEAATVEISSRGRIESQGPGNRTNAASRWGARVIREWARHWL